MDLTEAPVEQVQAHEARHIDGVLRGRRNGGVAQFGVAQIRQGAVHAEQGSQHVDAAHSAFRPDGLGSQQAPRPFFKEDFQVDGTRSRQYTDFVQGDHIGVVPVEPGGRSLFLVQTRAGRIEAEDLHDGRSQEPFPFMADAADGVRCGAGLHLGRPGEGEAHGPVVQAVQDLDGIAGGIDVRVVRAEIPVDLDAAGRADDEAGSLGQAGVRFDADGHDDCFGGYFAAALQQDFRFRDCLDAVLQDQLHAMIQQFLVEHLDQIEIIRRQNLVRRFDDGHIEPGFPQALRCFAADETAAGDDDAPDFPAAQPGVQFHHIGYGVEGEHVGTVQPADGAGQDRRTARCQNQFFIRFLVGFPRAEVPYRNGPALPVDGGHFLLRAGVDVVLLPEPFGIHEYQAAAFGHEPVQVVGQAAVGKGHIGPFFEQDDMRRLVQTAQAGGRGRSARDAADDDVFAGHGVTCFPVP